MLTTKHHEGFALWPSAVPHPVKGEYHAGRDLVGDLSEAVRARRMRMGLYYSGGYDWPYNDAVLSKPADAVLAVPHGRRYVDYVTAHWRELIDRYQPSVLWNDISWPSGGNLAELFAYYYNTVEEGVVNDRWVEPNLPRNALTDGLVRGAGALLQVLWRFIPERRKRLTFSSPKHCDFRTPEYDVLHTVSERKWELARGVGHSFGANRHEAARGHHFRHRVDPDVLRRRGEERQPAHRRGPAAGRDDPRGPAGAAARARERGSPPTARRSTAAGPG